ncbi:hypothetical protein VitviT2T_009925 [Vitis vinifera]|uniref:Uncharacterized protein n=1 Tax=Vitis vinifera TaxID=29760 RepID=A0ABY9C7T5_VITVI|nr:hypothetical protein VitviT2T_009925 [Vitis vinifera]
MGMMKRRRDEDEGKYQWMIRRCIPFKLAGRSRFHGVLDTSHGVTWLHRHKLGQGSFASVYSTISRSKSVVFVDDNGGSCIMPSELAVK